MECAKAGAAAAEAEAEEDEGRRMVACELEAAEALAGMARCSAARGGASAFVQFRTQHAMEAVVTSQDQPVAAEPTMITSPEKAAKSVEYIPTQLCSTSRPLMKFRRKLTEAEKDERKIRRVMANRESARQTIRRRQAMHLELTRKADDVLEENENLKKHKERMVEVYNSLKGRSEILKAQLAEVKKVAAGETEEEEDEDEEEVVVEEEEEKPNTSEAERFCSVTASTQMFLHNQPSVVPCFWPSIIPSSDVFPFQCASHPHNMIASQFPMPPGDIPCLRQGQEHMGNPRGGAPPYFVVPIPWLIPLLSHSSAGGRNSHHCEKCACSNNSNQMSSNQNMRAEAYNQMQRVCGDSDVRHPPRAIVVPGLFSPVRPRETLEPPRSWQVDDIADLRLASTLERTRHGLFQTNQEPIICSPKKAKDVFVATEARRRRKELMKLKNIHCK